MKRSTLRNVMLTIGLIALINLATVIGFNLLLVPKGVHLMVALSGEALPAQRKRFADRLTFKPLSRLIFRHQGNYCDLPMREEDGTLDPGQNLTLHTLIGAYENSDGTDPVLKRNARQEIEFAATQCDVNLQPRPGDYTPFQASIFWADPELFASLLRHGGDLNQRIHRPDKPRFDQLTPLAFAELLEQRIPRQAAELRQIQALIRQQQTHAPYATRPVAPLAASPATPRSAPPPAPLAAPLAATPTATLAPAPAPSSSQP